MDLVSILSFSKGAAHRLRNMTRGVGVSEFFIEFDEKLVASIYSILKMYSTSTLVYFNFEFCILRMLYYMFLNRIYALLSQTQKM